MLNIISKIYIITKLFFNNIIKKILLLFSSFFITTIYIFFIIFFMNLIFKFSFKDAYINLNAENVFYLNLVTNVVYGNGLTDNIQIDPPEYNNFQDESDDIDATSPLYISVLTDHYAIYTSYELNDSTTPLENKYALHQDFFNKTERVTFRTNSRVTITKLDNTQLEYSFDASSLFGMRYFQKRPSRYMVNYKGLYSEYDIELFLHGLDQEKMLNDDYILKLEFSDLTINNHEYDFPVTVVLYGFDEIKTHCGSIRFENEVYKEYKQNWDLFNIEDFYATVTGNLSFDLFNSPKEYDLFERDIFIDYNYDQNIVDDETKNIKCKIINENGSSKLNVHGNVNDACIGNLSLFKTFNNKWSFIIALLPLYITSLYQYRSVIKSNNSK